MTRPPMTKWEPIDEPVPGHRRSGEGASVVLLHGFTQTGLSWTPVTDLLSSDLELLAPDAPGHGRSVERRASIADEARLLGSCLPPSLYVGYSMGGRTALHVALAHPDRVRGLVLIGATPGIDDPDERANRRSADESLAARLLASPLDDFLNEWLSQPLFASLPRPAWNLEDRRRNTTAGLASSLRSAGTGNQDSLWSRLHEIDCPTVLVTGDDDAKFTDVARRMIGSMKGSVVHEVVPGCGHAVHLERPRQIATIVSDLLTRLR